MKREIRFRAWHNSTKEMYKDVHTKSSFYELFDNSLYELMQFTGLHDKNGKKIYEGDIIKFSPAMSDKPEVVKFTSGMFVVYNPNCCSVCKNGGGYICSLDEAILIPLSDNEENHAEVIGNTYENPELIKQ